MPRTIVVVVLWLGLLGLTPPAVGAEPTVITGLVKGKAGPIAGLALLERGGFHNNNWYRGVLVGPDGRFRIEVEQGGTYGLHLYASGYIYAPRQLYVRTGRSVEVDVTLSPETTRANDPVIHRVEFASSPRRGGPATVIRLDVSDPNSDLGPQVLALDARSGRVYALDPPRPVASLKANYPDGTYQLVLDAAAGPVDPRDWHFVVSDHYCQTTDILSYPHVPGPPRLVL